MALTKLESKQTTEKQASINQWFELTKSIIEGSPDKFSEELLPSLSKAKDQDGRTLAHVAATHGRAILLQKLKENGFDLDAKDNKGQTPAHLAAQYGHISTLAFLKKNGAEASFNTRNHLGRRPVHVAIQYGQLEALKSYAITGLDLMYLTGDDSWDSPAEVAARYGQAEVLEFLLDLDNIDFAKDSITFFNKIIHLAIQHGHVNVLELLRSRGFDLNTPLFYTQSTLAHLAVIYNQEKVLSYLKDNKVNFNKTNIAQETPRKLAQRLGKDDLLKYLPETASNLSPAERTSNSISFFSAFQNTPTRLLTTSCLLLLASEVTFLALKYDRPEVMNESGGDITLIVNSAVLMIITAVLFKTISTHGKQSAEPSNKRKGSLSM